MNKKILKILCVLNLVLFSTFSITGCNNGRKDGKTNNGKKNIKTVTVTTSFLNDMVTQIAKDKVKIETIIPAGEDPHVYVLKVEDHKKIESGDLISLGMASSTSPAVVAMVLGLVPLRLLVRCGVRS